MYSLYTDLPTPASLEQSLRAIWGAVSQVVVLILPQIKLNLQLSHYAFSMSTYGSESVLWSSLSVSLLQPAGQCLDLELQWVRQTVRISPNFWCPFCPGQVGWGPTSVFALGSERTWWPLSFPSRFSWSGKVTLYRPKLGAGAATVGKSPPTSCSW